MHLMVAFRFSNSSVHEVQWCYGSDNDRDAAMSTKLLSKGHQWKVTHLLFGALISFIGVLVLSGAVGFFWLEQDLEHKLVQPLLEREVNRVLDGFKSQYRAGGIFISQIQGLLTESPLKLSGDLNSLTKFLESLAKGENSADPRFSYIQFGNNQGELISINLQGNGKLEFYIQDALHPHGLRQFDRRPDLKNAKLLSTVKDYDPRKRPWYLNATSVCPMVSPGYFSLGADGKWNASITCEIRRSADQQGVLAVDLSSDRLQKLLDVAIQQSLISGIFILDANDNVLLKSERLDQNDKDFLLGKEKGRSKFNQIVLSHLMDPSSQLIDFHEKSREHFLLYQQPLPDLGNDGENQAHFKVVVISNRNEIFSILNHLFWLSGFALVLLSIGAITLIKVYRTSITFPLMRLQGQAEKVASEDVVSPQEFSNLYGRGVAIEEIVSVQGAVKKMANNLYCLYQELRALVDKDDESGLLSPIGVAALLQKMNWSTSTIVVIEVNNYAQLSDTLSRVELKRLWRSLCSLLSSYCSNLEHEEFHFYRHSESRLTLLMFGHVDKHQRVIDMLKQQFSLVLATAENEEMRVFLSMGVSYCSNDGKQAMEQGVSNAILALRSAQLINSEGFAVFQLSMLERENRIKSLLNAMDAAVIEDEFAMYYQPICDLRSGAIHGIEALMRWNSATLGMVPPSEFIALAEHSERISSLGSFALRQVMRDMAQLKSSGMLPIDFSCHVNVSARQMMHAHFFEQIRDIVVLNQLPPQCITLKLTESLLIDACNHIREQFNRISGYGFGLCLDDFGTGYSSLSTLHNFNFNCLKLDQSFVIRSTEKGRAAAVLPAIVGIAKSLGITCVAEGIELEAQAEVLRTMGCEYAQGFLLAHPMPIEQLSVWLKNSMHNQKIGIL